MTDKYKYCLLYTSIVADSEEDVENLRNYCKKNQPELKVAGDCVYSEEVEDAAIVNEINSCTPDILLVEDVYKRQG